MTIQSRPYKPDPEMCCERCVFGTGAHSCDPLSSKSQTVNIVCGPLAAVYGYHIDATVNEIRLNDRWRRRMRKQHGR